MWNPRDIVGFDAGDMVRFTGCTDDQVNYGGHDDPRPYLDVGRVYEVDHVEVEDYCSRVALVGYNDMEFNSVCFEVKNE